jgi:hypothetical protein
MLACVAATTEAGADASAAAGTTAPACATVTAAEGAAPVASAWSAAAGALQPALPAGKSLFVFGCGTSASAATGGIALLCNPAAGEFAAGAALPAVELARLAALPAGRIIFGKAAAAASVPGPGVEK